MADNLETLLTRLRTDRALLMTSEDATKQGAILPILAQLGWDPYNPREIVPEYTMERDRVDYCLKIKEKPVVFVEAKRAGEDLDRHQEQLLRYAFASGINLAVLTNGLVWWFYLPLLPDSTWDQRRFYAIDIQQQAITPAAEMFHKFLSHAAVTDGSAVRNAEEMHTSRRKNAVVRQTLTRAWRELCAQPDEKLLELFSDKVESLCGYRPEVAQLTEFLSKQTGAGILNIPSPRPTNAGTEKSINQPSLAATQDQTLQTSPDKRGAIGKTIYELFAQKGVDQVTFEEARQLALAVKPDSKFNKGHFSWYKSHYRIGQK